MKAIILAAGKGTRLGRYTQDLPKGMLKVFGKSIIERQVETYRRCGIKDIIIVTGYKAEKIEIPDVKYYHNKDYETTNMVESLFCAEKEFDDVIIVSYADVLFETRVLRSLIEDKNDIVVTTDLNWIGYWKARFDSEIKDTESLSFNEDNTIRELGTPNPKLEDIDGRYVGLLKFSKKGVEILERIYHVLRTKYLNKSWPSDKPFQKAYMTDLLQAVIDSGVKVFPLKIKNGWLEFDTIDDFEKVNDWFKKGTVKRFFSLDA